MDLYVLRAENYARAIHSGQVRKGDPSIPYIEHPRTVVAILSQYFSSDNNLKAAAWLHDVLEDASKTGKFITPGNIRARFNDDITDLVLAVTEPDKSLPWETRKQEMITRTRYFDLRTKCLVVADKISNLEDTIVVMERDGEEKTFSAFNRPKEKQAWYYNGILEAVYTNNAEHPLFERLAEDIKKVFV